MLKLFTILFTFLLSAISFDSFSQISEPLKSDRPGVSFSPSTVSNNILQIQGGVGYFNTETTLINTSTFYQNLMLRFGLKERIELNVNVNNVSVKNDDLVTGIEDTNSGLDQFDFGFRIHLVDRPAGFTASWQAQARVYAINGEDFRGDDDLGYITSFSLGYPVGNGGFVSNVGTSDTTPFLYTLNYSHSFGDNFSGFVEFFGNYDDEFTNYLDAGFAYLITKDLQIDISGGIDIDDSRDDFFIDGGISYRIIGLR